MHKLFLNQYNSIMQNKLGYIVSNKKIRGVENFIGVTNNFDDVIKYGKPILIVGLELARLYSNNFSILEKRISDNIFWTFDKMERKSDFDRDLDNFYNFVIKKSIIDLRYYYINVFSLGFNKTKKLLNFINSNENKDIFINDDMLYILHNTNVFGISLTKVKYCGIDVKKVFYIINANKSNIIHKNYFKLNNKIRHKINNKKYAAVYFLKMTT